MQLKLRVGLGDTLTIDVQPTDTFKDLSDRLYNLGGVKVDLSQLQRPDDRPFDMSTNVINYFRPNDKGESHEENGKPKKLCRLCSEPVSRNAYFLFDEPVDSPTSEENISLVEKVNASLPIHVSKHDHLPKQICEKCHSRVNNGFNFMKKVIATQETLEQIFQIKHKDRPVTNYKEDASCPLCSEGHLKHVDYKLRQVNGTIVSKKEVVTVPRANTSQMAPKKTPVSNPAQLPVVHIKEEPMDNELFDDNIVTGYWEESQDDSLSIRKAKKRTKQEDDHDWTIDEEYVPVSRRGRPRGTKNKPKVHVPLVEKSCVLCGWIGPDYDMYAHTINQHCQPDMGYFPCPLCKTNQPNEMYLETHIDKHNARK